MEGKKGRGWERGRGSFTRVSVCKVGLAGVESGVDGWQDAAVKGLGAVQKSHVFGRREVIIGADLRICAIARTL